MQTKQILSLIALFVALALWGTVGVRPAEAATVIVTNTNDTGAGSLRAQIAAAIAGDTIEFNLPANSTIALTSGQIGFSKNLIIDGTTATNLTISGSGSSRIFSISGGTVVINGLTLTQGLNASGSGGAINVSGAGTNVTFNRTTLTNNSTTTAGTDGGAITMVAGTTVTLNHSTLSSNQAPDDGGAINNNGGILNISHSTISGNQTTGIGGSNQGGGIIVYGNGTATIAYSTIANNTGGNGGGITVADSGGTGTINISASIVFGNTSVANANEDCAFIAGTTFNDNGYNLAPAATGCGFANNNVTTNPSLAALADNGGTTNTHAITAVSSAANVIPQGTLGCVANTPDGTGLTDQRSAVRAGQNSAGGDYGGGLLCDIGAFEFNATAQCGGGACNPTAVTLSDLQLGQSAVPVALAVGMFLLLGLATAVRLAPTRRR